MRLRKVVWMRMRQKSLKDYYLLHSGAHTLSRALARKRFGFWCNINIGAGGGSGAHTLEVRENIFKDDLGRLELDARLRSVRYRPNVFCQLILAPNRQRRALNSTPLGMCVRVRLQVKYACITA